VAEGPAAPSRGPRLERVEELRGLRPGDRRVRIVVPREFHRTHGSLVTTEAVLAPSGRIGAVLRGIRAILIGRPLPTDAEQTERVGVLTGLPIFASDNVSSSAYATEEAMRVLALAGVGALSLTMPLTVAIVLVLVVVVTSYLQVIRAYPQGGGSYVVASENLGPLAGLVAAAALLVDYVLTVAVSVAAGVAAISSAFPEVHNERVIIAILLIALLAVGNLRGVREAGILFAGPTYLYVGTILGLIAYGFVRVAIGDVPDPVPPAVPFPVEAVQPLGLILILRAFSSGAVALTGTEAVANGVPAFRPPESRNAGIVLVLMATLFGSLFLAISFLATTIGVRPDASETQTVLSLVARSIVGDGWYFYLVQATTAIILILAANTAFAGFPRLASIMAVDRFMPRQFAQRGERLAFSTGIIALAGVSAILVAAFQGSVTGLIPLYTVGVFLAFTLSQAGMVRKWTRERRPGWRSSALINAAGGTVTGVVALVVGVAKFQLGAWLVIAIMPVLVVLLYAIHRHYRSLEDVLLVPSSQALALAAVRPRVIVPISRLDRAAIRALAIARGVSDDIVAVHVSFDEEGARAFTQRWAEVVGGAVPLETIISPFRTVIAALTRYIDAIDAGDPARPIVVVLSEFVPRHWWEAVLHNQTALLLKLRLFLRRNTAVMDVPYHLDSGRPSGDDPSA